MKTIYNKGLATLTLKNFKTGEIVSIGPSQSVKTDCKEMIEMAKKHGINSIEIFEGDRKTSSPSKEKELENKIQVLSKELEDLKQINESLSKELEDLKQKKGK